MTGLRADKEHGRTIWTGGGAGSAADAGGCVHRQVGNRLRYRERIGIGSGSAALRDKSSRLDDAIERVAVHGEVAHDRKGRRAKWLDGNDVAIVKLSHVKLAGRAAARTMRRAVDSKAACTADSLAAIVVEGYGFDILLNETLVDDIEHLEK